MAAAHEDVGSQVAELGHDRRGVLDVLRVGLHGQNLDSGGFQVPPSPVGDRGREGRVLVGDHRGARTTGGQGLDGGLGVVARDGCYQEEIPETAFEHGVGGPVSLHHDDVVGLGDGAGARGEAARVGTEQEVDAVLVDELLDEIGGRIGVGLVVVVDDLGGVAASADVDPAVLLVHPPHPGVVALARVTSFHRVLAGLAEGCPDPYRSGESGAGCRFIGCGGRPFIRSARGQAEDQRGGCCQSDEKAHANPLSRSQRRSAG